MPFSKAEVEVAIRLTYLSGTYFRGSTNNAWKLMFAFSTTADIENIYG